MANYSSPFGTAQAGGSGRRLSYSSPFAPPESGGGGGGPWYAPFLRPLSGVLSYASKPLYTVGNTLEAADDLVHGDLGGAGSSLLEATKSGINFALPGSQAVPGFRGREHAVSDVEFIDDAISHVDNPWLRLGLKFGADVVGDPLTVATFGAEGAARQAVKTASERALAKAATEGTADGAFRTLNRAQRAADLKETPRAWTLNVGLPFTKGRDFERATIFGKSPDDIAAAIKDSPLDTWTRGLRAGGGIDPIARAASRAAAHGSRARIAEWTRENEAILKDVKKLPDTKEAMKRIVYAAHKPEEYRGALTADEAAIADRIAKLKGGKFDYLVEQNVLTPDQRIESYLPLLATERASKLPAARSLPKIGDDAFFTHQRGTLDAMLEKGVDVETDLAKLFHAYDSAAQRMLERKWTEDAASKVGGRHKGGPDLESALDRLRARETRLAEDEGHLARLTARRDTTGAHAVARQAQAETRGARLGAQVAEKATDAAAVERAKRGIADLASPAVAAAEAAKPVIFRELGQEGRRLKHSVSTFDPFEAHSANLRTTELKARNTAATQTINRWVGSIPKLTSGLQKAARDHGKAEAALDLAKKSGDPRLIRQTERELAKATERRLILEERLRVAEHEARRSGADAGAARAKLEAARGGEAAARLSHHVAERAPFEAGVSRAERAEAHAASTEEARRASLNEARQREKELARARKELRAASRSRDKVEISRARANLREKVAAEFRARMEVAVTGARTVGNPRQIVAASKRAEKSRAAVKAERKAFEKQRQEFVRMRDAAGKEVSDEEFNRLVAEGWRSTGSKHSKDTILSPELAQSIEDLNRNMVRSIQHMTERGPFLRAFSQFVTAQKVLRLLRPGYHARNAPDEIFRSVMNTGGVSLAALRDATRFLAGKGDDIVIKVPKESIWHDAYPDGVPLSVLAEEARAFGVTNSSVHADVNMFSREGRRVGVQLPGSGRVSQFSLRVGQGLDNVYRLHDFIKLTRKGMGPIEALERTMRFHMDYSDLAPFLERARRYFFPFLTYNAKTFPVIARQLAEHPGTFSHLNSFMNAGNSAAGDPDLSLLPPGSRNAFAIPLPGPLQKVFGTQGDTAVLNPEGVLGVANWNLLSPDKDDFARNWLSSAGPAVDIPATIAGYSPFLNSMQAKSKAPAIAQWLGLDSTTKKDGYTGEVVPAMPFQLDAALRQVPIYSQLAPIVPGGATSRGVPAVTNWITGIPIRPLEYQKSLYFADRR